MKIRPRRSLLYMPGSNPRALDKARSLPADGLILDMEDSVAPDAKQLAREQIGAAVHEGGYGQRELMIRINGLDTEWGADDINAICAFETAPDAVLIPKINTAADVVAAPQRVGRLRELEGVDVYERVVWREAAKKNMGMNPLIKAVIRTKILVNIFHFLKRG